MKSKKWIWVTLTVLLTLIVLAGVAGAGFRMGVMQSPAFTGSTAGDNVQPFERMHSFDGNFDRQFNGDPRMMQGFDHGGFDRSSFGSDRMGFFAPIFGLIRLAVLGALLWLGFRYVKNSGWRLTREMPQSAPVVNEKKDEA